MKQINQRLVNSATLDRVPFSSTKSGALLLTGGGSGWSRHRQQNRLEKRPLLRGFLEDRDGEEPAEDNKTYGKYETFILNARSPNVTRVQIKSLDFSHKSHNFFRLLIKHLKKVSFSTFCLVHKPTKRCVFRELSSDVSRNQLLEELFKASFMAD